MTGGRGRTDRSLRVGVVGLGYWGPNLLRGLLERPGVDISYVCDLDEERLATMGRRYPAATATACFEDLLSDPSLDAVLIATPVFTHFELAAQAVHAGKHTFVEKPLAPSAAEASELIDMADERDVRLMCGQTFLYSPAVGAIKRLIDLNELGEIFFISSSRVNLGLHQRDVSVVWDLGPHDFSILLHWLEEMPETITATGRDSIVHGIHDVAFLTLQFPSGIIANVELSWLAPSKLRRTAIVGSNKMVVYEDGIPEPVRVFDRGVVYKDPETFGEYHLSYRSGDILSPRIAATEPIVTELAEFVRLIRAGEKSGKLELARQVVMLAEAAECSLANGGLPVSLSATRLRSLDGRRAPLPDERCAMSVDPRANGHGIPLVDLSRQHAGLGRELRSAFDRVMSSGAFILGREVEQFEREFAAHAQASDCVGVASGTAALTLALIGAGIGPGDEVVLPGHTFIASVLGVIHAGATPVFCDVQRDTGLIDPDSVASVVGPHTAAVLAVHLYGQACDMARVSALAKRRGLFVLEDAAQAHGATHNGARVGSLGDAAAFSFYPSKNLGAMGDGGAVCTSDPHLAARIRELRDLGQRRKGEHPLVGYNERLDGLQAALLRVKLPHLDGWNATRRRHAQRLRQALPDDLVLLGERAATPCVYHLFPVRHRERDSFAMQLRAAGIQVGLHYRRPAHQHAAFTDLPERARPKGLPEAEAWAAEELSLPMFAELTEAELQRIAFACQAVCGSQGRYGDQRPSPHAASQRRGLLLAE